jgi:hypothetical protein
VRPENVATPELRVAVAPAVTDPEPLATLAVTVPVAPVTTVPKESSTFTTGWVARAVPLMAEELGWVVTASWPIMPVPPEIGAVAVTAAVSAEVATV